MALNNKNEILEYARERGELCRSLREMLVEQLCLETDPEFLTNDQPLFGRGLELDSIDSLELAVGIFDRFHVTINDGETEAFSSVNAMADYVMAHRSQEAAVDVSAGGFIDLDA
ncbi:MAG: acyl carrier protein [Clostridia bacterium]|nr:acyl carrier protein [Clostridia bacterium]